MDRCRKCNKPLMLGPSTCSNCGEPLFGMNTSPAINVPASTVQTHDSDMVTGDSQSTISTPTYTTSTSADGMHQDWTPTSTGLPFNPLRMIRRLVVFAFVGYWLVRMFGGLDDAGQGGIFRSVSDALSPPPSSTTTTTSITSSPASNRLPSVSRLPTNTRLPKVQFDDRGQMRTATLVRVGESTMVNFIGTGGGSLPTRSAFLSAGIRGGYPTVTANSPSADGTPHAESGELPRTGRIVLDTKGSSFAWRVVQVSGLRVVEVVITHGSDRVVLHGGGLAPRATSSGQSPLTYDELGDVADYFLARLDD